MQEEEQEVIEQEEQEEVIEDVEQDDDQSIDAGQDDDGVVVTIGDEPAPDIDAEEKAAPQWVKDVRKQSREDKKRIRELEAKLNELSGTSKNEKLPEIGKKPTLEDCDYDGDKFEQDLIAWQERKRKHENHQKDLERQQEEAAKSVEVAQQAYIKAKTDLKVNDYDDAEAVIHELFDDNKRAIIMFGADNPALLVYAVGKNQKIAKELAEISDPVKFAFKVAKLEAQLKVQSRKPAAAPEKKVQGNGAVSMSTDKTLDKLREEAARTGDSSKVLEYKRKMKEAKR